MSVSSQATQLADQINDEFLTCKICYEHYKEPKCLTCLHTFCEECIEQHVGAQRSYKYTDYREFSCPICRKKTVIPSGGVRKLTDNFLISNLNELMLSKKPSKVPYCDICKIINARERDATSKCVECQKHMCSPCVQFHSKAKITAHHSIFELDIEKDIMCKDHPNEQVRFYCETDECCVCVPCTFTMHRECDLVDFKEGIKHHKETIEENLYNCRLKIDDLKDKCDAVRTCETRILNIQNEIHSKASSFVEVIRQREKSLIEELDDMYGYETKHFLKKKDDIETFLDQLKSTCSLTDMVVKGKDIEMLLLKKQLCQKFSDFNLVQIDPVPKNIGKKINFVPGVADLGKLIDPEEETNSNSTSGILSTSAKASSVESCDEDKNQYYNAKESTCDEEADEDEDQEEHDEDDEDDGDDEQNNTYANENGYAGGYDDENSSQKMKKKKNKKKQNSTTEKSTQMTTEDLCELNKDLVESAECQTDDMTHSDESLSTKQSQTEASEKQTNNHNQSSDDENDSNAAAQNAPVDRVKLGRRVRRHVKPGCSIAVLPSSEIIIIDPEANAISILDRRGKFKYGMSNSNKPCSNDGHSANSAQFGAAAFGHLPRLDRGVRLLTPQGTLIVKLINESQVSSPPPSSLIGSVEGTPAGDRNGSETGHAEERVAIGTAPIADNEINDDEDEE